MNAQGRIASLWRHPVKGFTPERLTQTDLRAGAGLAHDRAYAVEDGASGFDPAAPAHISKMKFTVLAKLPQIARLRTRFNDATGDLAIESDEGLFTTNLVEEHGRKAFAAYLANCLGDAASGALKVIPAPGAHRFYDHPLGHVSLINLASVRDLGERLGRSIDPLRFRANILVEDWPAWIELDAKDREIGIGDATARVFAPIRRCAATHVDPVRGVRDIDMVAELQRLYGHVLCGIYLHVEQSARIREGDPVTLRA